MRTCKISKEPMQSGFVINDDEYIKYESDLLKEIITYLNNINDWAEVDKNKLLYISFQLGFHYYTEWDEVEL